MATFALIAGFIRSQIPLILLRALMGAGICCRHSTLGYLDSYKSSEVVP